MRREVKEHSLMSFVGKKRRKQKKRIIYMFGGKPKTNKIVCRFLAFRREKEFKKLCWSIGGVYPYERACILFFTC